LPLLEDSAVAENTGIFYEMLGNTIIHYVSSGLNARVNCGAGDRTYHKDSWVTSLPNEELILLATT